MACVAWRRATEVTTTASATTVGRGSKTQTYQQTSNSNYQCPSEHYVPFEVSRAVLVRVQYILMRMGSA